MAVWSDMNGFPEGGFPVLANANDMITLGQVYLEPLRSNNYVIDVLGNNRLAGALTIAGALTGCAGIAADPTAFPIVLPAGYKILATVGTTVASGYMMSAIGGTY